MGRKAKTKGTASAVEIEPEVEERIRAQQKKGDVAAGLKKYGDALAAYDEALKDVPERHSLVAHLHGCKAAVFLMDGKYKEAVKECNQGLAVEGNNAKVLLRRAKARYELGLYKDALSDISKVNSSAEKNDDSVSFETTVKAAVTGNKPGANSQVAPAKAAAKPPPTKEQTANMLRQSNNQFVCKVTMESETKILHLPYGISYYMLQQAIKEKWTGLHNFKILYQDRDQDWVLVTCARDVAKAQQDIIAYAQRVLSQRQRQGLDSQPPTWRLKIEKCNRADVPAVPREELPKGQEKSKVVVKSTDPHAEEMVVELDDWLIDFANLFRDQLSIDPDKHVDMQSEGADACQRALDTVIKLPEAKGLFAESLDRFRDVTCIGLCNWANVHLCHAKKLLEHAAEEGQKPGDIKKEFEEHCKEALKRYNEALGYNSKNVEAMLGVGQVYIEQARFEAGVLVPALDNVDSELYKSLNQEELEEISKGHGRDANTKLKLALKTVKKGDVEKSKKAWEKVYAQFKAAESAAAGEKTEKTQEREAQRADYVVSQPFTDETHLLPNQVKIIWGNALYDQSQIWAGVGLPGWQEMVEDAKARFLSATCKEKDVLDALRNHIRADELDLPPEEKPEEKPAEKVAPAAPAEAEAGAKQAGVKGLPSLKGKKKRNAA
eukprot:jgi/Ulvmu1/10992/UM007_0172.1